MASLVITNSFSANTTILSAQVNTNYTDIGTYINNRNSGTSYWDNVNSTAGINIAATTNQLILGTTRTATLTAPTPASASRTYTFPDLTGDYSVVATIGAQTIAGAKTFSDPITQNDTTNQIVLGVTNTTTISATAPSASRVVTIPDPGGAASFVMTEGTQTINGAKTFGSVITAPNGTITAPAYTFGTTTYGMYFSTGALNFTIPTGGNFQFFANSVNALRFSQSDLTWWPDTTTKTVDFGITTQAFDDMYADDFNNVADIPFFDFVKDTKTGELKAIDDLALVKGIKPLRDTEGNLMFNEYGHAYWDDSTVPEWIFHPNKHKGGEIGRDADGKPWVSLKVLCGLALGAIGQLIKKVEDLEAKVNG